MDIDTLILMGLLFATLIWRISLYITEQRRFIEGLNREAQDRLKRAERVKQLSNRL